MESLNRKASWVLALAAALLIGYQQHLLNRCRRNEASASRENIKLAIANADLKMQVARWEHP